MKRIFNINPAVLLYLISLCLLLFTCILIRPWMVYPADFPDMDMSATPNPVGSGARAIGTGGAFISVADDATAASWNPGGLLQLKKPEISIVGSLFSGRINYKTSGIEGDFRDRSPEKTHLNYLSVVIPGIIFRGLLCVGFHCHSGRGARSL